VALAQTLAGTVARTITSLYVLLSIDHAWPTPLQLLTAAVFGSLAVLAGAWLPASEAARVDPVAALNFGPNPDLAGEHAVRLGGWALLCLALGGVAVLVSLRGGPPVCGFAAALLVLVAAALLSPGAIRGFGRATASFSRTTIAWRLAADNLRRSVHRNAMTVAALSAAVSMLTSLTVMIFSFRECVSAWIGRGIVADLFIAPASNEEIGLGDIVPPAAVAWLEARPEVAGVDAIREDSVRIRVPRDGALAAADLIVVRGRYRHNLQFRGGDAEAKAARVFGGDAVAVTESFARRFGLGEGARVTILTPRGAEEFAIAGVYADYSRDRGAILIERRNFDRSWNALGAQSLAVFLQPGQPWQPVADAFRQQFGRQGEFSIYSNRTLRERILTIFDQTFEVTSVLRTVAVTVAVTGVYLAVLTLVTEREREIAALRAIGASAGQIQRLFMAESGMIGLIASFLGMAAGLALALLLTQVVNPAFFGWTIPLRFPWAPLTATPLWVTAAAALAAWRPAWKAARANLAEALRAE
jgi:putative ABC transport system permease protein